MRIGSSCPHGSHFSAAARDCSVPCILVSHGLCSMRRACSSFTKKLGWRTGRLRLDKHPYPCLLWRKTSNYFAGLQQLQSDWSVLSQPGAKGIWSATWWGKEETETMIVTNNDSGSAGLVRGCRSAFHCFFCGQPGVPANGVVVQPQH